MNDMPAKTSQTPDRSIELQSYKSTDSKGVNTSQTSWNKKKYTPKIITARQYERFRMEVPKGVKHVRWMKTFYVTLFDVLRYTGMRLSAALNIKLSDINWNEQYIVIREQKNGRVEDRHPFPTRLRYQLEHHIRQYRNQWVKNDREHRDYIGENDGYIFFTRNKTRSKLTYQAVDMFLHRLRQRSNWPLINRIYGYTKDGKPLHIISSHTLRHLYITEAVNKVGIAKAQSLARHEHIESTIRYTHIDLESKKRAIQQIYG